jgi:hypothetical protein
VVSVMVASCRTADVFADILCSDPEWVDSEFEAIVSGVLDASIAASAPSLAPVAWPKPARTWQRRAQRAVAAIVHETRSRIRSPP